MKPSVEEKAVAYRMLNGMQKRIVREKPFQIVFQCGDREWTAWVPQVITAPANQRPRKFVMVHCLTTSLLR